MREILFRGQRVGSEEWVEGFYLTSPEFDNQEVAVITTDKPRNPYYVSKETIGQYTGLTDKNGTKIFEGDIVNIYYPKVKVENTVISYIGASFYGDRFDDAWELDNYYQLEVIGNIHDNLELLKERDN